jgi:hypothetical protein
LLGIYIFAGLLLNEFKIYSRGIAQPGSARRSGRRGRGFESRYPDKQKVFLNYQEDFYFLKLFDFFQKDKKIKIISEQSEQRLFV